MSPKPYQYSGKSHKANNNWTPPLSVLQEKVNKDFNLETNSVFLNRYKTGKNMIPFHQDDEPGLGVNPVIVSLSLGQSRTFQLKHKYTNKLTNIAHTNGTIIVMLGATQKDYYHCVPAEDHLVGTRLNLTFRTMY